MYKRLCFLLILFASNAFCFGWRVVDSEKMLDELNIDVAFEYYEPARCFDVYASFPKEIKHEVVGMLYFSRLDYRRKRSSDVAVIDWLYFPDSTNVRVSTTTNDGLFIYPASICVVSDDLPLSYLVADYKTKKGYHVDYIIPLNVNTESNP